jgi:hypothetical protein
MGQEAMRKRYVDCDAKDYKPRNPPGKQSARVKQRRYDGWIARANEATRLSDYDTIKGLENDKDVIKAVKAAAKAWSARAREVRKIMREQKKKPMK